GFTARMRPSPTLMSSLPLIHASENPDGAPGHVPSMCTCASLPPASRPLNPNAASVLPKSCELMSITICDVLMRVLPFQLPCDWMVKSAPFDSNLPMDMPCNVGALSNIVAPSCALPSLRSPMRTCSGGIANGATGEVTCGGGGGPGCFGSGGSGQYRCWKSAVMPRVARLLVGRSIVPFTAAPSNAIASLCAPASNENCNAPRSVPNTCAASVETSARESCGNAPPDDPPSACSIQPLTSMRGACPRTIKPCAGISVGNVVPKFIAIVVESLCAGSAR